jgi:hypothetical protein
MEVGCSILGKKVGLKYILCYFLPLLRFPPMEDDLKQHYPWEKTIWRSRNWITVILRKKNTAR